MPGLFLLEELLQVGDVEPAVELVADLEEEAGLGEAVFVVEADAGSLVGGDGGDDGAVAEVFGAGEEVGEEGVADALAEEVVADVEGVFDGVVVGGAVAELGEGGPGEDFARGGGGDGDGVEWAVVVEPRDSGREGLGFGLVRGGGVEDVMVVDVVDGGEVGGDGGADGEGGHGGMVREEG
jgi:hypothetical protein